MVQVEARTLTLACKPAATVPAARRPAIDPSSSSSSSLGKDPTKAGIPPIVSAPQRPLSEVQRPSAQPAQGPSALTSSDSMLHRLFDGKAAPPQQPRPLPPPTGPPRPPAVAVAPRPQGGGGALATPGRGGPWGPAPRPQQQQQQQPRIDRRPRPPVPRGWRSSVACRFWHPAVVAGARGPSADDEGGQLRPGARLQPPHTPHSLHVPPPPPRPQHA